MQLLSVFLIYLRQISHRLYLGVDSMMHFIRRICHFKSDVGVLALSLVVSGAAFAADPHIGNVKPSDVVAVRATEGPGFRNMGAKDVDHSQKTFTTSGVTPALGTQGITALATNSSGTNPPPRLPQPAAPTQGSDATVPFLVPTRAAQIPTQHPFLLQGNTDKAPERLALTAVEFHTGGDFSALGLY